MTLKLEDAQRLIDAALEIARAQSAPPMTIVVLDADGALRALAREDRGSAAAADIAIAKARTALAFNLPSGKVGDIFAASAAISAALAGVLPGRFMPLAGALVLHDSEGEKVGAVAASGSQPDTDAAIVQEALRRSWPDTSGERAAI